MIKKIQIIKTKIRFLIPVRVLGVYYDIRRYLIESEHLDEFREFYSHLTDKRDIFYIFFTTGLLHWVLKSLQFIPDNVNIVLIGSDLHKEELAFINKKINRPFHHIRLRIDHKKVWDFLFKINQYHFGWLDVDCFVLNPQLFKEMTEIKDDVAINGTWSYTVPGGLNILAVCFLFLNVDVMRAIKARKLSVTPYRYVYDYEYSQLSQYDSKIITSKHIKLLRQIMPTDNKGRPVYPVSKMFKRPLFDTLVLYQLIAKALGYRINLIRHLIEGSDREYSDELIHGYAPSYYKQFKSTKNNETYNLLLQANFLFLGDILNKKELPEQYKKMLDEMKEELMLLGISFKDAKHTVREYLVNNGVGESVLCGKAWQFFWE